MVAGLGSLLNSDNSMMMKLINDISSLDAYQKATESKESNDNSSVEDIFSQIIDEINDNVEKTISAETGVTSPIGDTSNAQFGPPSGMDIEGLDIDSLNSIEPISNYGNINSSENVNSLSQASAGGGTGGGESKSDEDEEDSNDPMDLNGDGTVTTQEMLAYYQMQNSSYTQESTNNAVDEVLDLIL